MTEFNNNPMNTDQRSKVSLVLFIVSILILVMAGGYLVYAQNLIKTAKSTDDNTASKVTQSNEVSNTAEDNATTTNTTDGSTATDKSPRDPNRYYNDDGQFSYILPEEWKNTDLVFNVSPIKDEPDSGGACGNINPQVSSDLKSALNSKTINSDFTNEFKNMFVGIAKSKVLESNNGVKYAIGIDICNGVPVEENETANAIRFRAITYQDETEISLVYSVDQNTITSEGIKIGTLETLVDDIWNQKDTNPDIQALFNRFEKVMLSLKFENI